jgi:SAM-dependent methyltransferase
MNLDKANSVPLQRDTFCNGEGDAWFNRNRGASLVRDWIDECLSNLIPSGSTVLEVGSSSGYRLQRLQVAINAIDAVGIDPSAQAVSSGIASYGLDLRTGTADALPVERSFHCVIVGFCLYLCDPVLLPKIISEIDRVLEDRGLLIIIDFDVSTPVRRRYRHLGGVWSHKLRWAQMFLSFPQYSFVDKFVEGGRRELLESRGEVAMWVLRKDLSFSLEIESDSLE